jgi:hypothetical protein
MSLHTGLAIAALCAAVYLLTHPARLYPALAALAAGLQVAMALGIATFGIKGVSLALVFGAVLAVTGGIMFAKTTAKLHVGASTVLVFVGAIQLLDAVGVF